MVKCFFLREKKSLDDQTTSQQLPFFSSFEYFWRRKKKPESLGENTGASEKANDHKTWASKGGSVFGREISFIGICGRTPRKCHPTLLLEGLFTTIESLNNPPSEGLIFAGGVIFGGIRLNYHEPTGFLVWSTKSRQRRQ